MRQLIRDRLAGECSLTDAEFEEKLSPKGATQGVPRGATQAVPYGTTQEVPKGTTPIVNKTYTGQKQDSKATQGIALPEQDTKRTEDDILAEGRKKASTPEKKKSNHPHQHFMEWWRFWYHETHGTQIGKFTNKEHGQAKQILQKLGMAQGSEDQIGAFVEALFKGWLAAATGVKHDEGLKDFPGKPQLGFTLKYAYALRDAVQPSQKPQGVVGVHGVQKSPKGTLGASTGAKGIVHEPKKKKWAYKEPE